MIPITLLFVFLIGAAGAIVFKLCWDLDVHEPEDDNRGEK